jgi:hypothetical protein
MTLHPVDVGETTSNFLGRSPTESAPYFNGLLDDLRVYRKGLSDADLSKLAATHE